MSDRGDKPERLVNDRAVAAKETPLLRRDRDVDGATRLRRQVRLLTIAVVSAVLLNLALALSNTRLDHEWTQRAARSTSLATDAAAIERLQDRPLQAAAEGFGTGDLLERVATAMNRAGLPPDALISTLPQPPQRRRDSDIATVTHRLTFEDVTIEALTRFAYRLLSDNPELHLSAIHLRAATRSERWQVDLSVTYDVVVQ